MRNPRSLFGALILALGLVFASSGVAEAAPTAKVNFNGQRVHASGQETSGSSRSVCVVLWRGTPNPPRGMVWTPQASRCGNRATSSTITSVSTPAITCFPALYQARTTTYSGTGGGGSVVSQKISSVYSTTC